MALPSRKANQPWATARGLLLLLLLLLRLLLLLLLLLLQLLLLLLLLLMLRLLSSSSLLLSLGYGDVKIHTSKRSRQRRGWPHRERDSEAGSASDGALPA